MKLASTIKNIIEINVVSVGNEAHKPLADVIGKPITSAGSVDLYTVDINTGIAGKVTFDLRYKKTNHQKFAEAYRNYWYALEYSKVVGLEAKIIKTNPEDDDDEAAKKIALLRVENAKSILEPYKNSYKDTPFTVRILVYADRKMKDDDFPQSLIDSFKPVENALKKFKAESFTSESKGYLAACKEFRTVITESFCKYLWVTDNAENQDEAIIKSFVYNCNQKLADKIIGHANGLLERDADGRISEKKVNKKTLMREIILDCFKNRQEDAIVIVEPSALKTSAK